MYMRDYPILHLSTNKSKNCYCCSTFDSHIWVFNNKKHDIYGMLWNVALNTLTITLPVFTLLLWQRQHIIVVDAVDYK
jgi:hypothetical protein